MLAAAVGLAGCGVPGKSEPRTAGTAPGVNDPRPGSNNPELPSAIGIPDAGELVDRFFKAAAAGDVDPTLRDQRFDTAVRYAKDFLTPAAAQEWKPTVGQVVVIDVTQKRVVSADEVDVDVRAVGLLNEWGAIEALAEGSPSPVPQTLKFQVERPAAGGELRLRNAPPGALVLSTTALNEFYEARSVYFWDSNGRYLVPDRRYLNGQVNSQKRARAVVERLIDGPSKMIDDVVARLPDSLTITSNPVVENSRITVNLSAPTPLEQEKLERLARQLRWSLSPTQEAVEIQIDSRTRHVEDGSGYLAYNPTYRFQEADNQAKFGIFGMVNGKVTRTASGDRPMPVLNDEHNSNVVAAAVNVERRTAALVRQVASNRQELWFVREGPEGVGAAGTPNAFRAEFPADVTSMGRPVYLPGSNGRFLVPAQGRLFDVTSDVNNSAARTVDLLGRTIKAISVAPDGRRVAMIVVDPNGPERVVVATVNPESSPVSLTDRRTLDVGDVTDLRGVAWVLEHQLVVAAAGSLTEVTIDNSERNKVTKPDFGLFPVTAVAVVPRPTGGAGTMVVEGGTGGNVQSYRVYTESLAPITVTLSPSANPTPGASPAPTTMPVRGAFYVDLAAD
ncbi:lipoprotein [Virgisporangium aliadipatigenens]|uniref:Lipoprotein n=1 Tax=Virgisporangium aliadipatigenens TaxID=741659 RepID=A0A8J3YT54_9ACTN|nr:lipoprotein [Virgisporangium aliadipatigenens]